MTKNKIIEQLKLALIISFVCSISACFSAGQTNQNVAVSPSDDASFTVPNSNVNLAQPLQISDAPKDVAQCEKINRIIEQSEFANARWGFLAVSLKDGRVACGRDAQKLFNPASAHKILTSVVALDALDADFRWQTKLYARNKIENGILDGDLVLYGHGAPDFDDENLANLISQISRQGLKEIRGNIVGDESFFTGDNIGDGWTWNDLQWYYGAEASALSFDQNQAKIIFANGKPIASNDYVKVSSAVKADAGIEAVGLKGTLGGNQFYAWGNGDSLNARVAVNNPALFAAETLKKALEKKGISVKGEARSANWQSENKLDAANAVELASVDSQTLGEIVRKMNKNSVNLYAELILRTLGKRFGSGAPDENPQKQKLRGDDAAGASVLKKWLNEKNVAADEIEIHDGSGLSRLDFVTPEAVARALVYASQSKFSEVFKNSLPIAGTDGTLSGRLGRARGKILGKTGSITYVNALAGYAKTSSDETFAFVIFCNNQTRKADSSGVIDAIATILTE